MAHFSCSSGALSPDLPGISTVSGDRAPELQTVTEAVTPNHIPTGQTASQQTGLLLGLQKFNIFNIGRPVGRSFASNNKSKINNPLLPLNPVGFGM